MAPIILFSGTDCCGKDTTMHELAKITNYEPFFVPRSPICNLVYDHIYGRYSIERKIKYENLIHDFLKMGAIFILIYADEEILLERAIKKNEKHIKDLKTFIEHKNHYDYFFNLIIENFPKYKNHFFKFDSSKLNSKEFALYIKNKIEIE